MHLPLYFARRYLFSRKSHSTINLISAISAGGIAVATMAMVCVLSVFNGLHDLFSGLYGNMDAALQVVPVRGKYADAGDAALMRVRHVPGVATVSEVFEENALILYKGNPLIVSVRGVDNNYPRVTGLGHIIFDDKDRRAALPALAAADISYAVPGYGLAMRMNPNFGQVQICAPRQGERINLANPAESFNVEDIFSSGCYFRVQQKQYDDNIIITSLDFARRLFERPTGVTSLELGLAPGAGISAVKQAVRQAVGPSYSVRDGIEQHESLFRINKIEKLMAYFFLAFIILIACFNLIGSVAMLIIDKRANAATLRSLGMTDRTVSAIFLTESRLITFIGAVVGIAGGLLLCWLQTTFGLVKFGAEGNFIVDAYPVSVRALDVVVVFLTVIAVGFATPWYPVRYLCRRIL